MPSASTFFLIVGFGIGLSLLVFAPGNFHRISTENEGFKGIGELIYQIVQLCKHSLFVDVWVLIGVVSLVMDFIQKNKFAFVKNNWLYFLSSTIAFLFTVYTLAFGMMQGTWQLTIMAIMDVILTVNFLRTYMPRFVQNEFLYAVAVIILSVLMGVVYGYRNVIKIEKQAFVEDFYSRKSDTAYDGKLQYAVMQSFPSQNEFIYEKVCDMYCSFYNARALPIMSRYHTYGIEQWGTTILPEPNSVIIAHCTKDNQINDQVYLTPLKYYVVKMSKQEIECNASLVFELEKKDPFYRGWDHLRHKKYVERYPITGLITIEDNDYVYAVKRLDWWHYHKLNVIRAALE